MKDFDEGRAARHEREREFRIGGEVFVRKPAVRPEVMIAYEDLTVGSSAKESLEVIDSLILDFIESEGHDRYRQLRQRTDDPLNVSDLNELVRWLIAESTGRPTSAPSLSTAGRVTPVTGTPSTDNSSSEAAAASAA